MSGTKVGYAMWVVYGYTAWIVAAYLWDWSKKFRVRKWQAGENDVKCEKSDAIDDRTPL